MKFIDAVAIGGTKRMVAYRNSPQFQAGFGAAHPHAASLHASSDGGHGLCGA